VRVLLTTIPIRATTPVHTDRWPSVEYLITATDFVRRDADGNVLLDTRIADSAPPVSPECLMATDPHPYDTLDDEALLRHLSEEADRRKEGLAIEQRAGQWIAESYLRDGRSSGRSVMLGAEAPDRRPAMLGLAQKFDDYRW